MAWFALARVLFGYIEAGMAAQAAPPPAHEQREENGRRGRPATASPQQT